MGAAGGQRVAQAAHDAVVVVGAAGGRVHGVAGAAAADVVDGGRARRGAVQLLVELEHGAAREARGVAGTAAAGGVGVGPQVAGLGGGGGAGARGRWVRDGRRGPNDVAGAAPAVVHDRGGRVGGRGGSLAVGHALVEGLREGCLRGVWYGCSD